MWARSTYIYRKEAIRHILQTTNHQTFPDPISKHILFTQKCFKSNLGIALKYKILCDCILLWKDHRAAVFESYFPIASRCTQVHINRSVNRQPIKLSRFWSLQYVEISLLRLRLKCNLKKTNPDVLVVLVTSCDAFQFSLQNMSSFFVF